MIPSILGFYQEVTSSEASHDQQEPRELWTYSLLSLLSHFDANRNRNKGPTKQPPKTQYHHNKKNPKVLHFGGSTLNWSPREQAVGQ